MVGGQNRENGRGSIFWENEFSKNGRGASKVVVGSTFGKMIGGHMKWKGGPVVENGRGYVGKNFSPSTLFKNGIAITYKNPVQY